MLQNSNSRWVTKKNKTGRLGRRLSQYRACYTNMRTQGYPLQDPREISKRPGREVKDRERFHCQEGKGRQLMVAHQPVSLAKFASYRLSEKPCLKNLLKSY